GDALRRRARRIQSDGRDEFNRSGRTSNELRGRHVKPKTQNRNRTMPQPQMSSSDSEEPNAQTKQSIRSSFRLALRRAFFARITVCFILFLSLVPQTGVRAHSPEAPRTSHKFFSARDETFLEDLEHRSFRYFWEQAGSRTGLVLDRTRTDGAPSDENHRNVASIAAIGFGLTALCMASERNW